MSVMDLYKNPVWHEKAMQLYEDGMTDGAIAEKIGVERQVIFKWRRANDLKSKQFDPSWKLEAERLYNEGMNDAEIALQLKLSAETIYWWRKKKGLPALRRRTAIIKSERSGLIMELYQSGMTDSQIGKRIGASASAVGAWRLRRGLPPIGSGEKKKKKSDSMCRIIELSVKARERGLSYGQIMLERWPFE